MLSIKQPFPIMCVPSGDWHPKIILHARFKSIKFPFKNMAILESPGPLPEPKAEKINSML